jgi:hypothetical protein
VTCPECGEQMRLREDRFPDCPHCGYERFDADTLSLQSEVRREQALAKRELGYVPTYKEWVDYQAGKVKP